jgi:hypothetical protein
MPACLCGQCLLSHARVLGLARRACSVQAFSAATSDTVMQQTHLFYSQHVCSFAFVQHLDNADLKEVLAPTAAITVTAHFIALYYCMLLRLECTRMIVGSATNGMLLIPPVVSAMNSTAQAVVSHDAPAHAALNAKQHQ